MSEGPRTPSSPVREGIGGGNAETEDTASIGAAELDELLDQAAFDLGDSETVALGSDDLDELLARSRAPAPTLPDASEYAISDDETAIPATMPMPLVARRAPAHPGAPPHPAAHASPAPAPAPSGAGAAPSEAAAAPRPHPPYAVAATSSAATPWPSQPHAFAAPPAAATPIAAPLVATPHPTSFPTYREPPPAEPEIEAPPWESPRRGARFAAFAAAILCVAGLAFAASRLFENEPVAAPTEPPVAAAPPPSAPAPPVAAPLSAPERDARAALDKLRHGITACARGPLGVLPGTSPAIPPRMTDTRGSGYAPALADFRTPVWLCAGFRHDGPMRFQLQWQSVKANREGKGIAWVDTTGDGTADRVLAFRAALGDKNALEVGEVELIDAATAVTVTTW